MRSLIPGSMLVAALLLLPAAEAGGLVEVQGRWYWGITGTASLHGLPGLDTRATIFTSPEGSYWWRVAFDPLGRVHVDCADGVGALFVNGLALPAESCSLEFYGAMALPRVVVPALDAGAPPGQVGQYLGPLFAVLEGSGSYRVA